jgi:hypothetical protein
MYTEPRDLVPGYLPLITEEHVHNSIVTMELLPTVSLSMQRKFPAFRTLVCRLGTGDGFVVSVIVSSNDTKKEPNVSEAALEYRHQTFGNNSAVRLPYRSLTVQNLP